MPGRTALAFLALSLLPVASRAADPPAADACPAELKSMLPDPAALAKLCPGDARFTELSKEKGAARRCRQRWGKLEPVTVMVNVEESVPGGLDTFADGFNKTNPTARPQKPVTEVDWDGTKVKVLGNYPGIWIVKHKDGFLLIEVSSTGKAPACAEAVARDIVKRAKRP